MQALVASLSAQERRDGQRLQPHGPHSLLPAFSTPEHWLAQASHDHSSQVAFAASELLAFDTGTHPLDLNSTRHAPSSQSGVPVSAFESQASLPEKLTAGPGVAVAMTTHLLVLLAHLFAFLWIACELRKRRDGDKVPESETLPSSLLPRPPRLPHLDALRFVFALFIFFFHSPRGMFGLNIGDGGEWFSSLISWAHAMVAYFICLSGFVTQWTAPPALAFAPLRTIGWFYARRLTRVLLVTWSALLYTIIVDVCHDNTKRAGVYISAFLQVLEWWGPFEESFGGSGDSATNPNLPAWTVAVLVPCWLLFPSSQWLVARLEARCGSLGLACALLTLWAVGFARVLAIAYDPNINSDLDLEHVTSFATQWGPAGLSTFLMGMLGAALARRHMESRPQLLPPWAWPSGDPCGGYSVRGAVADAIGLTIALVFLLVPMGPKANTVAIKAGPTFQYEALGLPFVAFMTATAVTRPSTEPHGKSGGGVGTAGVVARLLSNRALEALGEYALTLYLLQWPALTMDTFGGGFLRFPGRLGGEGTMALTFFLVVLAIATTELFEKPLSRLLLERGFRPCCASCPPSNADSSAP